jgi:hypothetical protein
MTNKNDLKIIELKKQIAEKKDKLNNAKRFSPITNCSLELNEKRYNINVLTKEQLVLLMVKLNSYIISAKELGLFDDFIINGYHVEEWFTDIKTRLYILSQKEEERNLRIMESKLDKLLSDEKKTELELNEIEELLK